MPKKVILHIGLHKTGSTSIQASMKENQSVLQENGIFYPLIPINGKYFPNHSFMLFSLFSDNPVNYHMNQKFGFTTVEQVNELNNYYRSSIIDSINQSNCNTVILSAEDVSSLNINQVEDLKKFFTYHLGQDTEFKVIIYFRHLCDYVQSVIQQRVKDGGWEKLLLNELKNGKLSGLRDRVEKFITVFGKNNIEAFKFEDAINQPGSISGQFSRDVLGINIEHKDLQHSNKSLSYEAYLIHNKVNSSDPLYIKGKINPKRRSDDLLPIVKLPGQKLNLSHRFSDNFISKVNVEHSWIEDEFSIKYQHKESTLSNDNLYWSTETLNHLERIFSKLSPLVKKHIVDLLREQAIIFEKSNSSKALEIMTLAAKFRPNGHLINKKIVEYKSKIVNKNQSI